jgi:hypothetical protein
VPAVDVCVGGLGCLVSYLRTATTRPEAAVMAATSQVAVRGHRLAVMRNQPDVVSCGAVMALT